MTIAPRIEDLERMSDAELRSRYNQEAGSTQVALGWYSEELHRRALDRQARRLEVLTWAIAALTTANVVLVGVSVLR